MSDRDQDYAARMLAAARVLREAADAAFLPAVRTQLMSRVIEFENAAAIERETHQGSERLL
jgi:hypothetical protein